MGNMLEQVSLQRDKTAIVLTKSGQEVAFGNRDFGVELVRLPEAWVATHYVACVFKILGWISVEYDCFFVLRSPTLSLVEAISALRY